MGVMLHPASSLSGASLITIGMSSLNVFFFLLVFFLIRDGYSSSSKPFYTSVCRFSWVSSFEAEIVFFLAARSYSIRRSCAFLSFLSRYRLMWSLILSLIIMIVFHFFITTFCMGDC